MLDEYTFLRNQYLEIIAHTNYLLRFSEDMAVVDKAYVTRERAQHDLARLERTIPTNA